MDKEGIRRAAAAAGGAAFFMMSAEALLRFGAGPAQIREAWGHALLAAVSGLAWALYLLASGSKAARGARNAPAEKPTEAPATLDQTLPLIFHEIKNYAYTMKSNTTLLRNQLPEGDAHVSLERLERATERIEKLSREVMDFSLLRKPGEASILDLGGLIRSAAEGYFQGLGLAFRFRSDRTAFPVHGEARKLEQVFLNLFKNALEAGAKRIDVSLLAQPGKVAVLIEDDGRGCTPEQVAKMFDAYQSFRPGPEGTGLGLFLVKALVEGHGGTLAGFSKNRKPAGANGMVFVLQFPLATS